MVKLMLKFNKVTYVVGLLVLPYRIQAVGFCNEIYQLLT